MSEKTAAPWFPDAVWSVPRAGRVLRRPGKRSSPSKGGGRPTRQAVNSISLGGLTQPTTHRPTPSPGWERYTSQTRDNLPRNTGCQPKSGGGVP